MFQKQGKATILAVGTELTTGQITNRNAAWISEQLVNLGIEVSYHLTVADDHQTIVQALDWGSSQSQLIFITGGLGPTTDDFTRKVISDWLKKPLQFHEPTWMKIIDRLSQFGLSIAESNRSQSFFPEGAQIFPNPNGTAAGFSVPFGINQKLWAFPGPPNELNAVWNQGVSESIDLLVPNLEPIELFTWQCMGKPEAELGELTEKALEGSQLKTGYRAHSPYVEIKVWCPKKLVSEKHAYIQRLEDEIKPWVITRHGDDLGDRLLGLLQSYSYIHMIDLATGGGLSNRLKNGAKNLKGKFNLDTHWPIEINPTHHAHTDFTLSSAESDLTLSIGPMDQKGNCPLTLTQRGQTRATQICPPYFRIEWMERAQSYLTEMALKQWCDWLKSETLA